MRRSSVGATSVLIVILGLVFAVGPAVADPSTFSPSSSPFGVKFNEWSARWWQFFLSFSNQESPLMDRTGERCAIGQSGPVWLLAGSTGGAVTRKCAIPEGTALLFPIINFVDVNVANQTAEELRAEVAPLVDGATNLAVSVDGEPLRKLEKDPDHFRVFSTVFSVTLPPDNFFGAAAAPGTYSPAIDDGFYVMLKPLKVGHHTLRFRGEIPAVGFSVDVTYLLEIVATRLE